MQLFSFPNWGKTFFLPNNKLCEWERTAAQPMENTCSSAYEKPASLEVLLSSSELSFSLLMTFFPCPALLNNIPLPCCVTPQNISVWWDAVQLMSGLIRPIRSSNLFNFLNNNACHNLQNVLHTSNIHKLL